MMRNLLALVRLTGEGAGSRPRSVPLHQTLLGKPVIQLTLEALHSLEPFKILAVGGAGEELGAVFRTFPRVLWHEGNPSDGTLSALGTGPARDFLAGHPSKDLLVLDARMALIRPGTMRSLLLTHRRQENSLTVASGSADSPLFAARVRDLLAAFLKLGKNRQARLGFDGLVRVMTDMGRPAGSYRVRHPEELLAVGTPGAASRAVALLRERKTGELESRGVVVLDPATTWVDLDVRVGRGTVIYPSAVIEGKTSIGTHCRIYPFVHLIDSQVGDRVRILSSTMVERSRVGHDAQVGPFTHFRPNTIVRPRAKVGNFVEMKNTVFGERSRAGHLTYLGDTIVGDGVNIGAGTITCNYDGFKKSQTVIERDAFIGSGTELVAPVRIGKGAYVGAGSVITKDVSPGALAIARGRQLERPGWALRKKTK
jgi:bifunctional UDP-N-acetylglucosamine pyrophosphorylase / glucosamine-1-phosphate N-acetyltransferase